MYRLYVLLLALLALPAWAQTVAPTSLNFGSVTRGDSASKTVTVTNSSANSISIMSMGVTGAGFGMGGTLGTPGICQLGPLGANASCIIPVSFIPSAVGASAGMLTITGSDGDTLTVQLAGSGVAPVTGGGSLPVTLAPSELDFGSAMIGTTQMQMVTLSIPADAPNMALEGFSVSSADYKILGCPLAPMPAQSGCGFEVLFSPHAAGESDANITFLLAPAGSNAAATALTVPLKGTGVTAAAAGPDFSLTASQSAMTISAGAPGSTTLTITPVNGFGGDVEFACSKLPAGANCTFSPNVLALASGASSVQVTINNSGTSASALDLTVFGTFVLAGVVLPFSGRRRRATLLLMAVIIAILFAWACSGSMPKGSGSTTKAQSSQAVISATSGNKEHVVLVTLTGQ